MTQFDIVGTQREREREFQRHSRVTHRVAMCHPLYTACIAPHIVTKKRNKRASKFKYVAFTSDLWKEAFCQLPSTAFNYFTESNWWLPKIRVGHKNRIVDLTTASSGQESSISQSNHTYACLFVQEAQINPSGSQPITFGMVLLGAICTAITLF